MHASYSHDTGPPLVGIFQAVQGLLQGCHWIFEMFFPQLQTYLCSSQNVFISSRIIPIHRLRPLPLSLLRGLLPFDFQSTFWPESPDATLNDESTELPIPLPRDRSLVHFTCFVVKSFHLEQRFPSGTLCPQLRPTVASHPTRCLSGHLHTQGARNHSHQQTQVAETRWDVRSSRSSESGRTSSCKVVAAISHCSTCSRNYTISPLDSCAKSNGTLE